MNKKKYNGKGAMKIIITLILAAFAFLAYYLWDTELKSKKSPGEKVTVEQEAVPQVRTMEDIRQSSVKVYYDNGTLKAERQFKDGKLNGVYRAYYEDGVLKAEGNYQDDKLEGVLKRYA